MVDSQQEIGGRAVRCISHPLCMPGKLLRLLLNLTTKKTCWCLLGILLYYSEYYITLHCTLHKWQFGFFLDFVHGQSLSHSSQNCKKNNLLVTRSPCWQKISRQFESMEALFEYSNHNPSLFFSRLLARVQKSVVCLSRTSGLYGWISNFPLSLA